MPPPPPQQAGKAWALRGKGKNPTDGERPAGRKLGDPETPQGDGRAISPGGIGPSSGPGGGRVTPWTCTPRPWGHHPLRAKRAVPTAGEGSWRLPTPQPRPVTPSPGEAEGQGKAQPLCLPSPKEKPPVKGTIRLPSSGRHGDFRAQRTPREFRLNCLPHVRASAPGRAPSGFAGRHAGLAQGLVFCADSGRPQQEWTGQGVAAHASHVQRAQHAVGAARPAAGVFIGHAVPQPHGSTPAVGTSLPCPQTDRARRLPEDWNRVMLENAKRNR